MDEQNLRRHIGISLLSFPVTRGATVSRSSSRQTTTPPASAACRMLRRCPPGAAGGTRVAVDTHS